VRDADMNRRISAEARLIDGRLARRHIFPMQLSRNTRPHVVLSSLDGVEQHCFSEVKCRRGDGRTGRYGSLVSCWILRYANILVILSLILILDRPFLLRFTTSPPSTFPMSASCARLASSAPTVASSRSRHPLAYESLYRANRPKTGNVEAKNERKSRMTALPTSVTAGLSLAL